jgi:YidC/Oxa1 family membrane protein insertase
MDKKSTFGFILIGVILLAWMWLQSPQQPQQGPQPQHHASVDTAITQPAAPPEKTVPEKQTPVLGVSDSGQTRWGTAFAGHEKGVEEYITIATELYTAELSTRGGVIRKWELNKYKSWDGHPVQLVPTESGGDLSVLFTSREGRLINTHDLFFSVDEPRLRNVALQGTDSCTVALSLPSNNGGRIVKRFTFHGDSYTFGVKFDFDRMDSVISNFEYQVVWEKGIRYAEENSVDESSFAMAYAYSGGELTEVDASKVAEKKQRDITGAADWVAQRNKYFIAAMLPRGTKSEGAYLEGTALAMPNQGIQEQYGMALKMPYRGRRFEGSEMDVYLGPLEYDRMKSLGQGLESTMNLGAAWIIRPISEYVMIPLFKFLRWFIPNYGVVIIVFSLIIKIALHPLTRKSMQSMRKMQKLAPMIEELKEKYKDDQQKLGQATMNLYKEYGANPASGCLPMILQMPILFALYAVFRSSIELRQSSFVWWIQDLSIPDYVLKLPFTIPMVGIHAFSGLALLMTATTIIQQKQTVTDPRQKAMVWMMPLMMLLIFNNLPSGLNLYYFVFNLLSIAQQAWFNRQHQEEPLRKVDVKKTQGGILGRISKDMPKLRR